ncbi:MAG: L-aspartate oxidase [Elusimicrobia bacterium]|nr:L-aspartate oxidase [Elusimicrobiota bacterium]
METDFLVVGSGIAGLSFALKAAEAGRVTLVTKRAVLDSATAWAQGGVAAVMSSPDTFEAHIQDTLRAGAGLCHEDVVRSVVQEGPARIRDLVTWGVKFSSTEGDEDQGFALGLEGGHSHRRIIHAADYTGRAIEEALVAQVRGHPRIQLLEHHIAIDLLTAHHVGWQQAEDRCLGAYVLDIPRGQVLTIQARVTVLATGGAGKVYLYTSNPDVATGDGMAMAYRAGATLANMEFIQFHPTCLFHPQAKHFLISEAVRGEGGILRLSNSQTFLERYHPQRELAPRDVVARAIDAELKARGEECVYLDIAHRGRDFIPQRFPTIYSQCLKFGIDMTRQPIPVVPAAHYFCGGIWTDAVGATTVPGLYAIGEVACTGFHGANRLASNSLLEGLVFAHRAAQAAGRWLTDPLPSGGHVPPWTARNARDSDEQVVITQNWDEVRRFMWNYVGIVRTTKRLERALRRIELLQQEIQEYYWNFLVTADLLELRNIATVAELVIRSALTRQESRGLHYLLDAPEPHEQYRRDTLLTKTTDVSSPLPSVGEGGGEGVKFTSGPSPALRAASPKEGEAKT